MRKKLLVGITLGWMLLMTSCGSGDYGNAKNGDVQITEVKAMELALEQVPGATIEDIVEWDRDNNRGKIKYECEIHYQNQVYDFEIDATDGSILGWSVETLYD